MRTMRNKTPLQVWILGLSEMWSREPLSLEANSVLNVQYVRFCGPTNHVSCVNWKLGCLIKR